MREIKFRAWDNKAKSWAKWEDNFIGQDGRLHIKDNRDIILEQFTGLLDSNGREIYEGDILRCLYFMNRARGGDIETVKYDESVCGFHPMANTCDYDNTYYDEYEIVGNIHESE